MRVRNWKKFQHFKDRRPPWIKLYRDLLDDPAWHALPGDITKTLTGLWLLASEDETQQGELPDVDTIAFRLRMQKDVAIQHLSQLDKWLDDNVISGRYQDGPPETETETELKGRQAGSGLDSDPKAALWRFAVSILGEQNRPLIGKAVSQHGEGEVGKALAATVTANPADPKTYFLGCLPKPRRAVV